MDDGRLRPTVAAAVRAALADTHNCFTQVHADAAGSGEGELAGVPIAVKDLIDHAGQVTTAGSAFYRHRATATAPCLSRLERAGAVVIGRTGLHEFAFGFSSENPWFGPVRNPWDPNLSPGGSSGGSAAAVAAGIVPLAVGTDTGGSVRVPAALCGVLGLKTTHGMVPLDGVFPLAPSLDTVGPISSDLDLLAVAARLMAADRWPCQPVTTPLRLLVPGRWVEEAPLSEKVASAFAAFLAGATEAGIPVTTLSLPELGPSPRQADLFGPEVGRIHGRWRREGRPYGDDVGERVDRALATTDEGAAAARRWRRRLTEAMGEALAAGELLVTPTVAALDKPIGIDTIDGTHHRVALSWFTAPVNATGFPALSVPLTGAGRTASIQLIGPPQSEPRLLEAARRVAERGLARIVGMIREQS